MKVGIDIDGVVSNTPSVIDRVLEERGVKATFAQYHPVIEGIDDPQAFMSDVVSEIFSKRMHEIKPYDDALYELYNIDRFIGPITFVTSRLEKFNDNTVNWINENFPDISYTLVNREAEHKAQFLIDEKFDFFIEDRLKTANDAAGKGIRTFLVNRPWNMGRETHPEVIRISKFGTFFSIVVSKYYVV